jgi:hypothetical protein
MNIKKYFMMNTVQENKMKSVITIVTLVVISFSGAFAQAGNIERVAPGMDQSEPYSARDLKAIKKWVSPHGFDVSYLVQRMRAENCQNASEYTLYIRSRGPGGHSTGYINLNISEKCDSEEIGEGTVELVGMTLY